MSPNESEPTCVSDQVATNTEVKSEQQAEPQQAPDVAQPTSDDTALDTQVHFVDGKKLENRNKH